MAFDGDVDERDAHPLGELISDVVGTGDALRSAVVCFYLSNESVSMLENAAHLGLPIPEKLKSVLAQLHGRMDETDNKEDAQQ